MKTHRIQIIAPILFLALLTLSGCAKADRYKLYSHGNLLYKIDMRDGRVSVLLPASGMFADVGELNMKNVKPEDFLKWYQENVAPVIKADVGIQMIKDQKS